ncbi:MAG: PIN domain protein [Flavobacteriia bacterium]|nr:PIN domain protein [Flavobacteriia bacterium]
MLPRLYFDTSVFGGINDAEFQEDSLKLFEMVKNDEIKCVFSDLTERELENAPEIVKNNFFSISGHQKEFVNVTEDAYILAQKYIAEQVVGETSFDDCVHIATATLHKVDYLVSWNFKHIVNVFRIKGYNAVNMKNAYTQLDIRSPKEIIR